MDMAICGSNMFSRSHICLSYTSITYGIGIVTKLIRTGKTQLIRAVELQIWSIIAKRLFDALCK